ncbi:MAG: hypothetical protein AB8D78_03210 [Akkermansiaceae bacterium]
MSALFRCLLSFCIFAGMAVGIVHTNGHHSDDECTHTHSSEHQDYGGESGPHEQDHDSDSQDTPHHHDCCHYPSADRPIISLDMHCSLVAHLLEISTEHMIAPDEPLFLLDKPPLI